MINVDRITFRYEKHLPLFQDFSWQVARGQTWVIIGPSGCGKSTMLYLLAGLQHPEEGEIRIDGKPHHHTAPANRADPAGLRTAPLVDRDR